MEMQDSFGNKLEVKKLQGSDPNALPIPEEPVVKSVMDRITERGGFFF